MKVLRVKCPHCKKEFAYNTSDHRPFCSERCRMVDLGHWLEGSYAVPAQNLTDEEREQLIKMVEPVDEEQ